MNIAVTGASGFVGKAVLAELSRRHLNVVACVGSNSAACLPYGKKTVPMDLHTPPDNVFSLLGEPEVLIHLAWSGLPNYRSLHHFEVELPAQYRFLRLLIDSGLKALVVAGTCFEYGMQSGPLHEALPTNPVTAYGLAKDTLRRQLEFLKGAKPFALTWARLFYLYGDGQAPSSLLPQLRQAVDRGDAVFNMSGGEQLRDYLSVEAAAEALVDLALASQDVGVVNVCSGQPVSVRRLVEEWISENGWKIKLNLGHYPYPDYEPLAFWGDRRKLNRILEQR